MKKEQKKAIDDLLLDLDELENKPRRLFHALEEFAFAFKKENAVPSIREAQDSYYEHIRKGENYVELFDSLRSFKIKEWEKQIRNSSEIGETEERIYTVKAFIKHHIKEINKY